MKKSHYNILLGALIIAAIIFITCVILKLVTKYKKNIKEPYSQKSLLKNYPYMEPPSLGKTKFELNQIANKYSPIYVLSKDEKYYPANYFNILPWCSLRKFISDENGNMIGWKILVPAGSLNMKILMGDEDEIRAKGITLSQEDLKALQSKIILGRKCQQFNKKYGLTFESPDPNNNFDNMVDNQIIAISRLAGNLNNPDFHPEFDKTWYHNGAPGCPLLWKGGNCKDYSEKILKYNNEISWAPNPQFTFIQQKPIYYNGEFKYWVTDFSYVTHLAFNGSPSPLSSVGTHFVDVETAAVRFLSDDIREKGLNAKPVRVYNSIHGGNAWYKPSEVIWKSLKLKTPREGDTGSITHPVIYWGRESHEDYHRQTAVNRLFGVGNDQLGGGVIWQPKCLLIDILQDKESHMVRVNSMLDKGLDYYNTYVYPKDFDTSGEYEEIKKYNMWLFYCGLFRLQGGGPSAAMSEAKVRMVEGKCVGDEGSQNGLGRCKPSGGEPSGPTAEYVHPGCAEPMGDFERFDPNTMFYSPFPAKCASNYPNLSGCWDGNNNCCGDSVNFTRPDTIIAIVDVKIVQGTENDTFGSSHPDYTGVIFNRGSSCWLNGWQINGDNKRNPEPDNINTGSNKVRLWVKYAFVKRNSTVPILTGLTVTQWEDCSWYGSCSWTNPKCPAGYSGIGQLTSKSDTGCDRYGLCAKYTPVNATSDFISSVGWSYTTDVSRQSKFVVSNPIYAYDIDDVNKKANTYSKNVILSSYSPGGSGIQSGCYGNWNYIFLNTGSVIIEDPIGGEIIQYPLMTDPTYLNDCESGCNSGSCFGDGKCCIPNCDGPELGSWRFMYDNSKNFLTLARCYKPNTETELPDLKYGSLQIPSISPDNFDLTEFISKLINSYKVNLNIDLPPITRNIRLELALSKIPVDSGYVNQTTRPPVNVDARIIGYPLKISVMNTEGKSLKFKVISLKTCGDDGCGGNCGNCSNGTDCNMESGMCEDNSSEPKFVNFTSSFGKNIIENLNRNIVPFVVGFLSKKMAQNISVTSDSPDLSIDIMSIPSQVESPLNKNSIFIGVKKWNIDYSGFKFKLASVNTIINNLKVNFTPVSTNTSEGGLININIKTDPIEIIGQGYLDAGGYADMNANLLIAFKKGFDITTTVKWKMPSTKQYKGGMVEDVYFRYPTNNNMCDDTNPQFKQVYGSFNPCKDNINARVSDYGSMFTQGSYSNPLKSQDNIQGLGQHINPEGIFTVDEMRKAVGITVEKIMYNLIDDIDITVRGGGNNPLETAACRAIGGITSTSTFKNWLAGKIGLGDKLNDLIATINNLILEKVIVYPVI